MLIRINLLPIKAKAKHESGRQYIVGGVLFVGLIAAANYFWFDARDTERRQNVDNVAAINAQITALEKAIGEVNNIKQRKAEVGARLKSLDDLLKQRNGPVRLLDALASCIPSKVKIDDFSEAASNIHLVGMADTHDDVSEFMKELNNIVWTPKGMGRVIERKRDTTTLRVELLTGEAATEDFLATEVGNFFSAIELTTSSAVASVGRAPSRVRFDMTMKGNYSL